MSWLQRIAIIAVLFLFIGVAPDMPILVQPQSFCGYAGGNALL